MQLKIKHQKHKGSGDNIGRDKNINILFPVRIIILLFGLTLLFYTIHENQNSIKKLLKLDRIFKANDDRFKILVCPFKVMCESDNNKDIGLHIKERLLELEIQDSLNISPYYYNRNISNNFNADSAEYLQSYHNADLVIYGNYLDEACSNTIGDKVCYNWITDKKWQLDTLRSNMLPNSNYQSVTMKGLREGEIQGSTDYIIYYIAGLTSYSQHNLKKAIKFWGHIIENLNIKSLLLVDKMGHIYTLLNEHNLALKYRNEFLTLSGSKQDSSTGYNNLGIVLQALGEFEKSKFMLEKSVNYSEILNGEKHPTTAIRYSNLATLYFELDDYEKAQNLYYKALETIEIEFGEEHPNTAVIYSNLANILHNAGEYSLAEELLKKAKHIDEKNYGKDHFLTSNTYSKMAIIQQDLGNNLKAMELLEMAIEIDVKELGENHPSTAIKFLNLGNLFRSMAEYEKARFVTETALRIFQKEYGEVHPITAKCNLNLGSILTDLKKFDKAKESIEKAIKVNLEIYGENHSTTAECYSTLGLLLMDLKKHKESLTVFQKSITIMENIYGPNHPDIAKIYSNYGLVLLELKKDKQAISILQKSLESIIANYGPNHFETGTSYYILGHALYRIGNQKQANFNFTKSYNILKGKLPNDHPVMKNLEIYRSYGNG